MSGIIFARLLNSLSNEVPFFQIIRCICAGLSPILDKCRRFAWFRIRIGLLHYWPTIMSVIRLRICRHGFHALIQALVNFGSFHPSYSLALVQVLDELKQEIDKLGRVFVILF